MRSDQTSREFIRYLKELDEAAEVACVGKEFQKLIVTYKGECIKKNFVCPGSRIELALRRDAAFSGFADNQCLRPIEMCLGVTWWTNSYAKTTTSIFCLDDRDWRPARGRSKSRGVSRL